jgi:tetratricopeptide (TPR) repeat protein
MSAVYFKKGQESQDGIQCLEMWRKLKLEVFGEKSREYLATLCHIAAVYSDKGRDVEALKRYEECQLEGLPLLGKYEHITVLSNIARVHTNMRMYDEALQKYEECRSLLDETHPFFLSVEHDLGVLYCEMGDFSKAVPILEKCLKQFRSLKNVPLAEQCEDELRICKRQPLSKGMIGQGKEVKTGRNSKCGCGSGVKFKRCCERK